MKNFHLPLPEETYAQLRQAAERQRTPATTLARQAIDVWLAGQARAARAEAIAAFAATYAGTPLDLDEGLEAAGLEVLKELPDETW